MKLDMQGSVAFAGLKFPAKVRLQDWFGTEAAARIRELMEARRRALGRKDDEEQK